MAKRKTILVRTDLLNRLFHATELLVPPSGVEWSEPIADYVDEADRETYDESSSSYSNGRVNFFRLQYARGEEVEPPTVTVSNQTSNLILAGMHRLAGAVLAGKRRIPIIVKAPDLAQLEQAVSQLTEKKGRQ